MSSLIYSSVIPYHTCFGIYFIAMDPDATSSLPELYCQTHSVRKEVLNLTCLSPKCASLGLLCRLCCSERHHSHDTITIAQLVQDVSNCQFEQSLSHKAEGVIASAKESRALCLNIIGVAKQAINDSLDKLLLGVGRCFDREE